VGSPGEQQRIISSLLLCHDCRKISASRIPEAAIDIQLRRARAGTRRLTLAKQCTASTSSHPGVLARFGTPVLGSAARLSLTTHQHEAGVALFVDSHRLVCLRPYVLARILACFRAPEVRESFLKILKCDDSERTGSHPDDRPGAETGSPHSYGGYRPNAKRARTETAVGR
jgi:hypothetical protein